MSPYNRLQFIVNKEYYMEAYNPKWYNPSLYSIVVVSLYLASLHIRSQKKNTRCKLLIFELIRCIDFLTVLLEIFCKLTVNFITK